MKQPWLVGRTLAEAEQLLAEAGVKLIELKQIFPPRRTLSGALRVVRERHITEGVYLVVAASVPGLEG